MSTSSESQIRLRQFAQRLLEYEGALVEAIEPAGLEAMLPAEAQLKLHAPEFVRLGFAAELPPSAQRVSLESDWLERFDLLLGDNGLHLKSILPVALSPLTGPERLVEHRVSLSNAVFKCVAVTPGWTRYLILVFRYTAISDEKREGIIKLAVNTTTTSLVDSFVDELLAAALGDERGDEIDAPPAKELSAPWQAAEMNGFIQRILPDYARSHVSPFVKGMQRRFERDLAQVLEYYSSLRWEAWKRLRKHGADSDREQLRLDAAAREYQAKVDDLRQKYALRVQVELIQTVELICPVQRIELLVKRRKGERRVALDWNPLTRQLDPMLCEAGSASGPARLVCDDRLHITAVSAQSACSSCGKAYCRACHPRRCPRCNQAG